MILLAGLQFVLSFSITAMLSIEPVLIQYWISWKKFQNLNHFDFISILIFRIDAFQWPFNKIIIWHSNWLETCSILIELVSGLIKRLKLGWSSVGATDRESENRKKGQLIVWLPIASLFRFWLVLSENSQFESLSIFWCHQAQRADTGSCWRIHSSNSVSLKCIRELT